MMLAAYSVAAVRAAEAAADGAAARGRAHGARGARPRRGRRRAPRRHAAAPPSSALVGAGNNGGDTLYAVAHLAEAGFDCRGAAWQLAARACTRAGLAAAEAAGVVVARRRRPTGPRPAAPRPTSCSTASLGIGGRPGLRDRAVGRASTPIPDDALGHRRRPAERVTTRRARVRRTTRVFADETVTFGVAKPVHLLPADEAAAGRLTVVDIGLELDDVPAAVERLDFGRRRRGSGRCPAAATTSTPAACSASSPAARPTPGAAVLCCTAAAEAGVGMLRYVGTPTPTGLVRAAVPEAVHGDGPGAGLGGRARARHRLDGPRQRGPARRRARGPRERPAGRRRRRRPRPASTGRATAPDPAHPARRRAGPPAHPPRGRRGRRRDGRSRPTRSATPAALADLTGATVLLKGATTLVVPPTAQGSRCAPRPTRRPGSPRPAPVTCSPGSVGALLAAGLEPARRRQPRRPRARRRRRPGHPGGPLRALAVAHGIPATVAAPARRADLDAARERLGGDERPATTQHRRPAPAPPGLPACAEVDLAAISANVAALERAAPAAPR